MKKTLLLSVFFLTVIFCFAQETNCPQTLRLARSIYEQGRLHEVPDLLLSCMQFSKQEKVEAYKLMCLSYIYLEEPEKADEAMLKILETDHYFQVNESTDPAEFVALYRTFRTEPIYRLGGKLGANASLPNVLSYVPANDGASEYTFGTSFQGGVAAEFRLSPKIYLNPELNFMLRSFKYENSSTYTEVVTGEERDFVITGRENQTWISLPVSVQYNFGEKKFTPFVSVGLSFDYLLGSTSKFLLTREQASSLDEQSLDIGDQRNRLNYSAIGSVGAKIPLSGGFAVIEGRVWYGLTKVNDEENIFALIERSNPTNGYVDGIFKMNSFSLTLGYVYNVFSPKKLRK